MWPFGMTTQELEGFLRDSMDLFLPFAEIEASQMIINYCYEYSAEAVDYLVHECGREDLAKLRG